MGGVKNMEPDSSQWCPGQEIPFKRNKKLLCFESDQTWAGCPEKLWSLHSRSYAELNYTQPWPTCIDWCCSKQKCHWPSSRGTHQSQLHLVMLEAKCLHNNLLKFNWGCLWLQLHKKNLSQWIWIKNLSCCHKCYLMALFVIFLIMYLNMHLTLLVLYFYW